MGEHKANRNSQNLYCLDQCSAPCKPDQHAGQEENCGKQVNLPMAKTYLGARKDIGPAFCWREESLQVERELHEKPALLCRQDTEIFASVDRS